MNPQNPERFPSGQEDQGDQHRSGGNGRSTLAQAASKVKAAATQVRQEATEFATQRKTTAAERIGGYSNAIHDTARSLEEKDPNIAWFTHRAADRLQSVADYVRDRDFSDLRGDVENFARRHPAAFFGGLLLTGLVLGNVVKASRRKAGVRNEYTDENYYRTERWIGDPDRSAGLGDTARSAAGI